MSNADNLPRDLLKVKVPEGVPTETGFFEISGTASSEAVNSRVYRWFLDREVNPQLAPLFRKALQRLALEKLGRDAGTKLLALQEYECLLEVTTSSGNRIDILLDDPDAQSAIIIENKLHHSLQNDLLDYWNHISYPEDHKLGVLLTLYPTEVPESVTSRFVNLTHLDWIEAVESEGIPIGLPLHTYGMMTDFFNAIRTQSKNEDMNEQAQFYFDNPAQVWRAKECWNEALTYVKSELEEVGRWLDLSVRTHGHNYCHLKNPKRSQDAFYTVNLQNLLRGNAPTISVILELQGNAIQYMDSLDRALDENPQSNELKHRTYVSSQYVHYRTKEFALNSSKISTMSEVLVRTIREDFEPVMNIIHGRLDELYGND